ncbi:hypothetical protein EUGRSUZ_K01271 [Eucalyptus grandis]|uniref:Uncharacterized protein n=2 Tax=Eucalyptus grandis TaxID=71139 RepID=A0ACC3ITT6_EUCGR|nr:hypothetical protein EUGRSUZ_K01271 [Eucalyptus grandis]
MNAHEKFHKPYLQYAEQKNAVQIAILHFPHNKWKCKPLQSIPCFSFKMRASYPGGLSSENPSQLKVAPRTWASRFSFSLK